MTNVHVRDAACGVVPDGGFLVFVSPPSHGWRVMFKTSSLSAAPLRRHPSWPLGAPSPLAEYIEFGTRMSMKVLNTEASQ